jgi:L-fuculose-phosphate aldolase
MKTEYELKEQICEIGRRVYNRGFAAANDGNITVRLNERELLCTPTMVSKGYMKPEDICKIDPTGKQLAGKRKRSSEALLHLTIYNANPKINAVVHCHPPHATAFAIAHEPIPKCILPEVEVFLGEVPMAIYETPGTQKFADTVKPFAKDSNTIILANHGTVSFAEELEKAYFNTEIVDAYCRMLILAKQLGRINYFTEQQTRELLDLKKKLGYDDPRFHIENCDLCGNSAFREGYTAFVPEPVAFRRDEEGCACSCGGKTSVAGTNGQAHPANDLEDLVQTITNQVVAALAGSGA